MERRDPGAGDDDVEPAVPSDRLGHQHGVDPGFSHVGGAIDRALEVDRKDLRAIGTQAPGRGEPDAGPRAGDQR